MILDILIKYHKYKKKSRRIQLEPSLDFDLHQKTNITKPPYLRKPRRVITLR